MARYTYITADLATGTLLEEIPFGGVTYGKVLNAPGSFSGSLPARHPKCTRTNLDPGRTALYVLRDTGVGTAACVWGGIIWTARKAADSVEIQAEGFWSYFRRRVINPGIFIATPDGFIILPTDQFDIAREALYVAQGGSFMSTNKGSLGVTGTLPGSGDVSGVNRVRTVWEYELKPVGEFVEQLAAVENGFDFEIAVDFDGVSTFTKRFAMYYPHKGTRLDTTWEVGVHCDLNDWSIDATQMANRVFATGAGDGAETLIDQESDPNTDYRTLDRGFAWSNILEASTLAEHARAALEAYRLPSVRPTVSLVDTAETTPGSFHEGDEIRLTGNDGFVTLDGYYRIMGYDVKVSDEGDESTAITFQDAQVAY